MPSTAPLSPNPKKLGFGTSSIAKNKSKQNAITGKDMDDSRLDLTATDLINRISFEASQDISSLKNIGGETGKKLTNIDSSLINDLQNRIL